MKEKEPSYNHPDLIEKLKENSLFGFTGFATAFKEHILQERGTPQQRLSDMDTQQIADDKADITERVLDVIQRSEPDFSEEDFTFERAREIVCKVLDIPNNDDNIVEIK